MYLSLNSNCKTRVLKAMHHQNKKLKKCALSGTANCTTMTDEKCDKSEVQNNIDVPNNSGIVGSSSSNDNNDSGRKVNRYPPLIPILANHEQWKAWQQSQSQNPQPAGFDLKDLLERMPVPTIALTIPPLTMPFWIPQHHPGAATLPPLFPPISPGAAAEIAARTGIPCSQPQPCPSFYHVDVPSPSLSPGIGDPRANNAVPPPSSLSVEGLLAGSSASNAKTVGCQSASTSSMQKDTVSAPAGIPLEHLQQLLEAQSEQNSQLRKIVGELQSELADYKRRVIMLETDFETMKTVIGMKTSKTEAPGMYAGSVDSTLQNEKWSGPHQAPSEMMKKLNYAKVCLKKVDYDIPILHKPDGQPAKKSKKGKGNGGGEAFLEKLLVPKTEEATAVEPNATQKVDVVGTISSSKAPLNPDPVRLVKIEQQKM